MMGWIVLGFVAVVLVWVIGSYNGLVALRNQVINGWKQIDVQLKRRHDLIPNLVNAVKGAMEFEKGTLERVIQARNAALGAQGPADAAGKEAALTQALGKLNVVFEQYPQLKATENVKQLQEELTSTENKIGFARQFYNDIATSFNTAVQVFPKNIIANLFGFQAQELFEVKIEAEREVPQVDLAMKS